MTKRIVSRLLILAVVLFGVTLLTFFYTSLSPVDAAQALAVRRYIRPTEEQVVQVRHELGLDQPLIKQYTDWLGKAIHGDFGNSYNTGRPIIEELTASMKPTLKLAAMALLFTALLSIPLGVLSAARKGGFADKTVYLFGIVCMSVPNYWIGFMLMIAFAVNIPIFSIMGAETWKDFVLPSLAVAVPTAAANIRVFRSSLLDGYNSDFVMYARARGISERKDRRNGQPICASAAYHAFGAELWLYHRRQCHDRICILYPGRGFYAGRSLECKRYGNGQRLRTGHRGDIRDRQFPCGDHQYCTEPKRTEEGACLCCVKYFTNRRQCSDL